MRRSGRRPDGKGGLSAIPSPYKVRSAKVYLLSRLIPNVHMYGRGIGARGSNWINADVTLRPSLRVITMDGTLDKKREALGAGPLLEGIRLTCAWSHGHMCSPSLFLSLPLVHTPSAIAIFCSKKKNSRASMGGRATTSAAAPSCWVAC